jgi:ABC-2 type transport system permease protein
MAVALVVVRLKLALLAAGMRSVGITGLLSTLFAIVLAVAFGGIGALLFALVRTLPDQPAMEAAVGGFALLLVLWTLGPVVTSTSDGTLDVDKLTLFPLAARQLMPGLLGGALVGFGGLATVLTLAGAFAGLAPLSPLALVTAVAVVLELAVCATCSRLVATTISGAVRTRRWRDVALFAGPAVALSLNLLFQIAFRTSVTTPGDGGGAGVHTTPLVRALLLAGRLLPSGPAAMAAGFARSGRVGPALGALVAGALVVFAGLALWHQVLERTLMSSSSSSSSSSARAARGDGDLFPALLRWLPPTRLGAVAAKEVRVMWRDPRQRVAQLTSLFIALFPLLSIRGLTVSSPAAVLFAAAPAYGLATTATTLYGFDGLAHWMNVAAGDDARSDLLGKWVARLVVFTPLVVVAATVLAVRAGSAAYVAPAIGLAAAAAGTGLGMGSVVSVRVPYPMPTSRSNVFATGGTGRGATAGIAALVVVAAQAMVLGPLVLGALLLDGPLGRLAVMAAGVAAGVGAARLGLSSAVRWSGPRQAELLAALQPRHA